MIHSTLHFILVNVRIILKDRWYRLSDVYRLFFFPSNPASVAAPLSWIRGPLLESTGFEVMQRSAAKKKTLARVNGLEGFFPDRSLLKWYFKERCMKRGIWFSSCMSCSLLLFLSDKV